MDINDSSTQRSWVDKFISKLELEKGKCNTIPEGESIIEFCGELDSNPKEYHYLDRFGIEQHRKYFSVNAIMYFSDSAAGKITGMEHELGLPRVATTALVCRLQERKDGRELKGRKFKVINIKFKRYIWIEITGDKNGNTK